MRINTNTLAILIAATALAACVPARSEDNPLPLYPQPRTVKRTAGMCDLAKSAIVIPANANEKCIAVAEALADRLKHYLKLPAAPNVRREGAAPKGCYVFSLGRGAAAWADAAKECSFDQAHPTLRDQAYRLKIEPDGATLVAPGSWGLAYGAVTLMQLARCAAEGTRIPCATILDWPDLELRAVLASSSGIPPEHRRAAGAICWDGKLNMLSQNFGLLSESHPEMSLKVRRDPALQAEYAKVIREIRGAGVDIIPSCVMDRGHFWELKCNPYAFMRDNETSSWVMRDMIDERLELFRSRYLHLGMDEEQYSMSHGQYPNRTIEQWRDVAAGFTKYLRRKGVMSIVWSDSLTLAAEGSQRFPWPYKEKLPEGFNGFVHTFPNDMILEPWFYWVKSANDVLEGKGQMLRQAKPGHPVIFAADGGNIEHHIAAARQVKQELPNVLGVMSCAWGPSPVIKNTQDPRHPRYAAWAVGRSWNLDAGKDAPKGFVEERNIGVSNWECLFDADPPDSIEDALKRLNDPAWRAWLAAREELVAAGLPAAPVLLDAMSKGTGDIADRIEGCLSRNARDARNGRKRGALDLTKALSFLSDKNEAVRDMAAELAASCSDRGVAEIRKRVKDPAAGASCIRALRIAKDKSRGKDCADILADKAAPVSARIEAARTIGILKYKEGADAAGQAVRAENDREVRMAALWALVLNEDPDAARECVALLDSEDLDIRYRAAMGLLAMKSPELEQLTPWLSADRDSMEIAAMSMYLGWDRKKMAQALQAAKKTQKDDIARARLDEWLDHLAGKPKKK